MLIFYLLIALAHGADPDDSLAFLQTHAKLQATTTATCGELIATGQCYFSDIPNGIKEGVTYPGGYDHGPSLGIRTNNAQDCAAKLAPIAGTEICPNTHMFVYHSAGMCMCMRRWPRSDCDEYKQGHGWNTYSFAGCAIPAPAPKPPPPAGACGDKVADGQCYWNPIPGGGDPGKMYAHEGRNLCPDTTCDVEECAKRVAAIAGTEICPNTNIFIYTARYNNCMCLWRWDECDGYSEPGTWGTYNLAGGKGGLCGGTTTTTTTGTTTTTTTEAAPTLGPLGQDCAPGEILTYTQCWEVMRSGIGGYTWPQKEGTQQWDLPVLQDNYAIEGCSFRKAQYDSTSDPYNRKGIYYNPFKTKGNVGDYNAICSPNGGRTQQKIDYPVDPMPEITLNPTGAQCDVILTMDQCIRATSDPAIGAANAPKIPVVQTEAGQFGCYKNTNNNWVYYNPEDGYKASEAIVDHTSLAQYICGATTATTTTAVPTAAACEGDGPRDCQGWSCETHGFETASEDVGPWSNLKGNSCAEHIAVQGDVKGSSKMDAAGCYELVKKDPRCVGSFWDFKVIQDSDCWCQGATNPECDTGGFQGSGQYKQQGYQIYGCCGGSCYQTTTTTTTTLHCFGGWQAGDSWSRDTPTSGASTKEECVDVVKKNCPTANAATFFNGKCFCEIESCGVAHADGGWESANHCLFQEVAVAPLDSSGCSGGWVDGTSSHYSWQWNVGGASSAEECLAMVKGDSTCKLRNGDEFPCKEVANGATYLASQSKCFANVNQSTYMPGGADAPGGWESAKSCFFGYWCGWSTDQQEGVATTTTTTDPSAPSWTCNKKSNIGVCLDGLDDTETETEITCEEEERRECQKWCYSKKHTNKPWKARKCQWYACAACPECSAPPTTTTTTDPSAPSWTCNKKSDIGVCLDGLDDAETETEIADEEEERRECQKWCYSKKHTNKPWKARKCQWYACAACLECTTTTTKGPFFTTTPTPTPVPTSAPTPAKVCRKSCHRGEYIKKKACTEKRIAKCGGCCECTGECEPKRRPPRPKKCLDKCYRKRGDKSMKKHMCYKNKCGACPECQPAPAPSDACDGSCYTAKGALDPSKQCGKQKCAGCTECISFLLEADEIDDEADEDEDDEDDVDDDDDDENDDDDFMEEKMKEEAAWVKSINEHFRQ